MHVWVWTRCLQATQGLRHLQGAFVTFDQTLALSVRTIFQTVVLDLFLGGV